MKGRFHAALLKADPRVVWLGMIALAALVAFEGWHLVVRVPLAQYRQLHDSRIALAAAVAAAPREPAALARVAADLKALSDKLHEELRAAQSDDQLTAFLMTELDRSAGTNGTLLQAVKPGTRKAVATFEELSYDVAAEGRYLMLCNWLIDLERVLGPSAAVAEFSLKAGEARQAAASVKVALYRGRAQPQAGK